MPAGSFPGAFPGQPGPEGWGAYAAGGAPPVRPSEPSKLIRPLPLWAFIVSIVVVAGVLALLTLFTGSDWAAGASTAGIVALVVAVLILIAFGVRAGLGMLAQTNPHRRTQIISALLLTLLLILVGFVGLTQQAGIHTVQAHSLEGRQQWQQAINEYQLGGQGAPSSEDIARTYNGWGKALVDTNQYAEGITKFETVIGSYNQATNGYAQAKQNAISAYAAWAQSAEQSQKFDQATQRYDKLLAASYCDTACQSQYGNADANDYYKLAEQKLTQQPPDYAGAVAAFNQLTTRFSSSSYSKQAHADYAKALWGDGQQLLTTTCSSALTLYQQLSSQFSDTPQGQQATTALKQSVKVKGHFTSNIPSGNALPFVSLVQDFSTNMTSSELAALLDKSPQTVVNSNGDFVFSSVKQGSYYLLWGTLDKSNGGGRVMLSHNYPASVGPLCAFDFGDINETFPSLS
jgi:tetratricopeptide (TPR) repeat protein